MIMMKMTSQTLIIKRHTADSRTICLRDILQVVIGGENLHWAILWIYAVGDLGYGRSMLEFEDEVGQSETGVRFCWDELIDLSNKFDDIYDILVVGAHDKALLRKYATDEEMYAKCDYTFELADSSYWIVTALNAEALAPHQG